MFKFIIGIMFGISVTFNIVSLFYITNMSIRKRRKEFEKRKIAIRQKINGDIKTM